MGLVRFILADVTIWTPILAIILALISIYRNGGFVDKALVFDRLFAYILLLPLGIHGLWVGSMHVFFPDVASAYIGWEPSPFEYEVGMANISLGVLGIIAYRACLGFRTATVIGASVFLVGDAIGHIIELVTLHNFAPGNAGIALYNDIILPIVLITLLILCSKWQRNKTLQG